MVSKPEDSQRRLKKLIKEALPRAKDTLEEKRELDEFHRPKFGAKGMASSLSSLALYPARRAVEAAHHKNAAVAEAEIPKKASADPTGRSRSSRRVSRAPCRLFSCKHSYAAAARLRSSTFSGASSNREIPIDSSGSPRGLFG